MFGFDYAGRPDRAIPEPLFTGFKEFICLISDHNLISKITKFDGLTPLLTERTLFSSSPPQFWGRRHLCKYH
jgi:hypothetical protein